MSQLLIIVVVVLMPGIAATSIADKLTIHSQWDSFKFTLYALVLGMLNYSLLQLLAYGWDVLAYAWSMGVTHRPQPLAWTTLAIWRIVRRGDSAIPFNEVALATLLAIPEAFVVSALVHHKLLTRFGRWIHATNKYGDESLYAYLMSKNAATWVYVRDIENGLTFEGRLGGHSQTADLHELLLHDVIVYRYEEGTPLYFVPTAYLSREAGKLIIEIAPGKSLQEHRE